MYRFKYCAIPHALKGLDDATCRRSTNPRAVESFIILDSAVQDDKAMQDFESESLLMRGGHSQKVKASRIKGSYGLKDCVALSSSTAESRIIQSVIAVKILRLPVNVALPCIVKILSKTKTSPFFQGK